MSGVKTSLTDFILNGSSTAEPAKEEATNDETTEETSVDTETTDDEGSASPDNVESTDGSEVTADAGTSDDEQVFEVKGSKVPLKDLLNAFETREEISRRFGEVGKREAKIKADLDRAKKEREELDFINEKFEEMHELVLQGNPMAALQIALNMNPKESSQPKAMKELIEQAIAIAENFQGMTEEEQKVFLEKEELSVKERNLARKEKQQAAKEAEAALKSYYEETLTQNGITDPEIVQAAETIESLPQFKAELEKKTDPKERINYVSSWVLGQRLNNKTVEAIKKVDSKLVDNREFRLALFDHIDAKSTVEEIETIVREYVKLSNSSANSGSGASTKSAESKPATSNRAPTVKPKAENNKPILSWDDMIAKHSA